MGNFWGKGKKKKKKKSVIGFFLFYSFALRCSHSSNSLTALQRTFLNWSIAFLSALCRFAFLRAVAEFFSKFTLISSIGLCVFKESNFIIQRQEAQQYVWF